MTQEQPDIVSLPVLVLKDLVLFPHCVMRFRPNEMLVSQRELLERAADNNEQLFIVKSRTGVVDMPQRTDLPRVGVIATAGPKLTCTDCCSDPMRMAPTSGPIHEVVPPIIGIAMELTAYSRPKAEVGWM